MRIAIAYLLLGTGRLYGSNAVAAPIGANDDETAATAAASCDAW
jgi:hypothetical protein